jgi:catechol 2,3-dioxygenase-like lactoylglutathione lyase family enzyme
MIESISAITLATHDMARAVRFYRMLGFEIINWRRRSIHELSSGKELSQSDRATCRAQVVLVGTRDLLPFRR